MKPQLACLASALLLTTSAQAWEIERTVDTQPGTQAARKRLQAIPALREIVAGEFGVALVDLDDDGHKEMIVMSGNPALCNKDGCQVIVVTLKNGHPLTLLKQNLPDALGVTREKIGAYHALAALSGRDQIASFNRPGTAQQGKPMVFAMAGEPVTTAAAAPVADVMAAPGGAPSGPDILGIRLGGSSAAEVRQKLEALRPAAPAEATQAELVWEPGNGPKIHIEGSKHVSGFRRFVHGTSAQKCPADQQCDNVWLLFAEPPQGQVLYIKRDSRFPPVPQAAYVKALVEKYGNFGGRREQLGGLELIWAWGPDGKPLSRVDPVRCGISASNVSSVSAPNTLERARGMLAAGCAQSIAISYVLRNDLVELASVVGFDAAGMLQAQRKTEQYIASYVDTLSRRQRESAAGNAAPRN